MSRTVSTFVRLFTATALAVSMAAQPLVGRAEEEVTESPSATASPSAEPSGTSQAPKDEPSGTPTPDAGNEPVDGLNKEAGATPSPSTQASESPADPKETPRVTASQEPAARAEAQRDIMPLATNTSTDIVVTARVTAQPQGVNGSIGSDVSNTVGAKFRLHAFTSVAAGPQAAIAGSWATCTIASGGSCTINVPNTNSGGANANKQYWVVQESAGSGAYFSDQLRTGSYNGPTGVAHQLGYTPTMSPNTTIPMPRVDGALSADLRSFGAVANSLNNLPLVSTCTAGLKVAIVMDLSDSVSSTQRTTFRNAIVGTNGLFDSLMNTNSSIAVFTFGMDSPAGGTLNYPAPMALTAANRNTLNGRINTATNGTQGTNWDRALRTVATANATHGYDLVSWSPTAPPTSSPPREAPATRRSTPTT